MEPEVSESASLKHWFGFILFYDPLSSGLQTPASRSLELGNEGGAMLDRAMAPPTLKTERFRNWTLIGVEIIATGLAFYAFFAWAPELPGWGGLIAGFLIVWSVSREFRGVAINRRVISFPRGRLARFPVLSLGRQLEVGAAGLRELMVMEPWHGFQVVRIEGWFGSELLVFQSRGQRRRFVRAFEQACPNVPIYRKGRSRVGEASGPKVDSQPK
jgi:hypothetical protein